MWGLVARAVAKCRNKCREVRQFAVRTFRAPFATRQALEGHTLTNTASNAIVKEAKARGLAIGWCCGKETWSLRAKLPRLQAVLQAAAAAPGTDTATGASLRAFHACVEALRASEVSLGVNLAEAYNASLRGTVTLGSIEDGTIDAIVALGGSHVDFPLKRPSDEEVGRWVAFRRFMPSCRLHSLPFQRAPPLPSPLSGGRGGGQAGR